MLKCSATILMMNEREADLLYHVNVWGWVREFMKFPNQVTLSQPRFAGYYSVDQNFSCLHGSKRFLKKLSLPDIGVSLLDGYVKQPEETTTRDRDDEDIKLLFEKCEAFNDSEGAPILTYRGILTGFACSVHSKTELTCYAKRITQDSLISLVSERTKCSTASRGANHKACYAGRQFERVATTGDPKEGQFYVIVQRKIQNIPVMFAAEMDCAHDLEPKEMEDFVELKTYRQPRYRGKSKYYVKQKAPRIWFQSHICGIEEILSAVYDDNWKIVSIEKNATQDIGETCRNAGLDTEAMLAFVVHVLNEISRFTLEYPDRTIEVRLSAENESAEQYFSLYLLP